MAPLLPIIACAFVGVMAAGGAVRLADNPGRSVTRSANRLLRRKKQAGKSRTLATRRSSVVRSNRPKHEDGDALAIDKQARLINSYLLLSASALGVAALGPVVAPPLAVGMVCALLNAPPVLHIFRHGIGGLIKTGRPNMATVDSLMITVLASLGQWIVIGVLGTMFFISRKMVIELEDRAGRKVIDIFRGYEKSVWMLVDGTEVEVPFDQVKQDDILVARAGEVIPADGVITAGTAAIDQSLMTGESQPAERGVGDAVMAATTVLAGKIYLRVERSGETTMAGQIAVILNRTMDYRLTLQWRWLQFVDRMALPALASGAITWVFLGPLSAAAAVVAVGNVGAAMRTVAPIQLHSLLRQAARSRVLIKDGRVFEQLLDIDTVVFDKTGTLTEDRPCVGTVYCFAGLDERELLQLAASVEQYQTHPIARAILLAAAERSLAPSEAEDIECTFGFGLKAKVAGRRATVGSARFMADQRIALPEGVEATVATCHDCGYSLVWVAVEETVVGAIELRPAVRREAESLVRQLHERGLTVHILSGDHDKPTQHLAKLLGIDKYFAEVLPDGKADVIDGLQKAGRRVCFVGDGVNDALALKKATVSVSLRGATTIATDTAQVVLMDQTLSQLPLLFDLARAFKDNGRLAIGLSCAPLVAGAGGVLLVHMGLIPVLLLFYGGQGLAVAHAVQPLLKRDDRTEPSSHTSP